MQNRAVPYWITTGLFTLAFTFSGYATLTHQPAMVEGFAHLGYPLYFMTILGAAKLLGVATLLAPRLPRLKEWAYAGFAINTISAGLSHLAAGDGAGKAIAPFVFFGLLMASWSLRPASRTLEAPATEAPLGGVAVTA